MAARYVTYAAMSSHINIVNYDDGPGGSCQADGNYLIAFQRRYPLSTSGKRSFVLLTPINNLDVQKEEAGAVPQTIKAVFVYSPCRLSESSYYAIVKRNCFNVHTNPESETHHQPATANPFFRSTSAPLYFAEIYP